MALNRTTNLSNRSHHRLWGLVLALVLITLRVSAQPAGIAVEERERLTIEQVETQLSRAQEAADLDDATRTALLEAYKATLDQLRIEQGWREKAAQFEEARQQTPDRVKEIETQLSQPAVGPEVEALKGASLTELNEALMAAEAELASAVNQRAELEAEPARRAEQRRRIPELLSDVSRRLEEARAQIGTAAPTAKPLDTTYARRLQTQARIQAMGAERDAYEKELRSYEARGKLLTLRQDLAARRVAEKQQFVEALRQILSAERQKEARQAAAQADKALLLVERAGPWGRDHAKELADRNAALAERRIGPEGLLSKIQQASQVEQELDKTLAAVATDFKDAKAKAQTARLTEAIGLMLRRHQRELPDVGANRARVRKRNEIIAQAQFDQLERQAQRRALADIDSLVSDIVNEDLRGLEESQRQVVAEVYTELYTIQRDYLSALLEDYDTYIDLLLRIQLKEQQLIGETESFSDYIAERILWIPSGSALGVRDFRDSWLALLAVLDLSKWFETGTVLISDMRESPVPHALVFLLLLLFLTMRRRLIKHMEEAGDRAGKATCVAFRPTLEVFAASVLISGMLPALFGFLAWRLNVTSAAGDFERALGFGLGRMALVLLTFEFPRQIIRSGGLAERHFNWPSTSLKRIRRHVLWMTPIAILVALLISFLEALSDEPHVESLGRLAFVVAMASFVLFGHVLMRPEKGPIPALLSRGKRSGRARLQVVWYIAAAGIPLVLALLACAGYYFTALRLSWRAYGTLFFGLGMLTLRGLVLRWLQLVRRRLAMEQARKRREALRAQAVEGAPPEPETEEPKFDLIQIDAQTQSLVRSVLGFSLIIGLWFIWADVLPALKILDQVELWHTTREVTETVRDAEGMPQRMVKQELVPVTLSQLGLAIIVVIMTLIFFRNLPGLLEFALLSRLPLGTGERYAISSIVGYAVLATGIILAFELIGIGWTKVQWIIAAMGVGLGFGLQEIFANFISGLIILFEQPIRVGDTVTIGDITGTVSKIRIRATRIVDWDRKELVVPNKAFVTGQLINWTLSDSILRVIIPVGISYGSDTERAVRVLYDVARQHPLVLDEPKPQVLFLAFGDSSLNLELRVFCPNVESFLQVKHELHMTVDQAFRKAGIEIAFPQRDIHVRSIKAELPISERHEKENKDAH